MHGLLGDLFEEITFRELRARQRIRSGTQTIELTVPQPPAPSSIQITGCWTGSHRTMRFRSDSTGRRSSILALSGVRG